MGKKKEAAMSIDSIISQITSPILSALRDEEINEPEQIHSFIERKSSFTKQKQQQIKCVVIYAWVDKDSGEDQTLGCIGVYKDYEKAYGAALLYLDEMAENECDNETGELMITTTVRLEGETGWGLFLKNKDGKDLYRTYILDTPEEERGDEE